MKSHQPSLTFQLPIVPSVMVGLSAGMFKFEAALFTAVARIPVNNKNVSHSCNCPKANIPKVVAAAEVPLREGPPYLW